MKNRIIKATKRDVVLYYWNDKTDFGWIDIVLFPESIQDELECSAKTPSESMNLERWIRNVNDGTFYYTDHDDVEIQEDQIPVLDMIINPETRTMGRALWVHKYLSFHINKITP